MDAGGAARADQGEVALADGTRVVIRPIGADDQARMAAFHAALSMRSVYQRYFHLSSLAQRIAQARLSLTCEVDPASGLALVAEHRTADGGREVLALGRLRRTEPASAEIALLVIDRWQGLGLGGALMQHLVTAARKLGLRRLHGDMLAGNDAMRAVVRHAGFVIRTVPGEGGLLRAELSLDPHSPDAVAG